MESYKSSNGLGKKFLSGALALGFAGSIAFAGDEAAKSYVHERGKQYLNPKPVVEIYDPGKKPEKKVGENKEKLPARYLKFDLSSSPLDNYDANSNAWYSANQLAAKGTDFLGTKLGFDKKAFGRAANTLLNLYLSGAAGYYSHEIAHNFVNREHGVREGFGFDSSEWWGLDLPGLKIPLFPGYRHSRLPNWWKKYSKEEFFRMFSGGLNQDEINAKTMWKRSLLEGNADVHNRIPYLLQKLSDTVYVLTCGFNDVRPDEKGLTVQELLKHHLDNGIYDDVNTYTLFLYNEGIDMTKGKYFGQTAFSDLASWYTLESIASVWRYLTKGERNSEPTTIKLAKDLAVSPPLFNQYMTSNGTFRDAGVIVNPGEENPVSFSLGKYIGPTKDRVKDWRVGAQVHDLSLPLNIEASPYLYLDMDGSSFGPEGFSAGSELFFPLKGKNGVWAVVGYNKNDIFENRVKGKKNGLDLRFGLKIKI